MKLGTNERLLLLTRYLVLSTIFQSWFAYQMCILTSSLHFQYSCTITLFWYSVSVGFSMLSGPVSGLVGAINFRILLIPRLRWYPVDLKVSTHLATVCRLMAQFLTQSWFFWCSSNWAGRYFRKYDFIASATPYGRGNDCLLEEIWEYFTSSMASAVISSSCSIDSFIVFNSGWYKDPSRIWHITALSGIWSSRLKIKLQN